MNPPWTLDFWKSGEYQVVRENLDDEQKAGFRINPERKSMFKALSLTPMEQVRVAIIGQDPYPQHDLATGLAFSVPKDIAGHRLPPTLRSIFDEYCSDLGYPRPSNGDLSQWAANGVLLWNAIPSCREGCSLSHDWPGREWDYLTREIVGKLSRQSIVFAFLGSTARRFVADVDDTSGSVVIQTSHPSPRGSLSSRTPFRGSRLFSTINDKLIGLGMKPIDWRLEDAKPSANQAPSGGTGVVRPNLGDPLPIQQSKPTIKWAKSTFELPES